MNPQIRQSPPLEATRTYYSTEQYTMLDVMGLRCWLWAFCGPVGGFRSGGVSAGVRSDRSAQLHGAVCIDENQNKKGPLQHSMRAVSIRFPNVDERNGRSKMVGYL